MEQGGDSHDILQKVLTEHKEKGTEFYDMLSKFLDVGGWDAMVSAMTGSPLTVYTFPTLVFPSSGTTTLTQTSTASVNFVFAGSVQLPGKNYRMAISFPGATPTNSPQIKIGIYDKAASAPAGVAFPSTVVANGFFGYDFFILPGATRQISTIQTHTTATGNTTIGAGPYTETAIGFQEINGQMTISVGNPVSVTINSTASAIFSTDDRYLHVYRCDASSGSGNSITMNMIAWPY